MKKTGLDSVLISAVGVLVILGILIIFSVSAAVSRAKFGNTHYFLSHQLLFGLIPGLVLAFLALKLRLEFFKKWAPVFLLINVVLMFLVFFPKIGVQSGGASRWLNLGIVTLQPSEFLKFTFILYLAAWLSGRTARTKLKLRGRSVGDEGGAFIFNFARSSSTLRTRSFLNETFVAFLVIIFLITLLLVLQSDVSTLGIIILTAMMAYFLTGTPLWHMMLLFFVGFASLLALIKISPYRLNRILVFLKPGDDPLGIGYHVNQALIAVGSGGIFGLGLGMSQQKFGFLPQTLADSIFAVYSEELGFIGGAGLIFLFLIFFWRGFKIGLAAKDKFSQLLAFGITFWIVIQAFINIGSAIGVLPLAGIPLPFISYGGSALISELFGVGMLLNISKSESR